MRSFEEHFPSGFLGRTATQKLAYFAKVLGAPIPCSYEIYTYGPYSDTVTFSVDSLLADEVLTDRNTQPHYSNYRLGPNSSRLLGQFEEEVNPHIVVIDRVVGALGSFAPKQLELIATLHFINQRQKQIRGQAPTKDEVIEEFLQIKGEKFPPERVESFYEALKPANLI